METKHTPGPWSASGVWVEAPGVIVAQARQAGLPWSATQANARLMAAAPRMAAMLLAEVNAVDAGELLVSWSPEYVRENGLDSPEANQDSARALLAELGFIAPRKRATLATVTP